MTITKKAALYSGKVKTLYETSQADLLIAHFRDDMTAFNGVKHEILANKGMINNYISNYLMAALEKAGIPTHFEREFSQNEVIVRRLSMIPVEVVVRNIAAGSICRRLGIEMGRAFDPPLQELFLKNDALNDPLICDQHAIVFGWATQQQLDAMRVLALKANQVLKNVFQQASFLLVDAKYEFGVDTKGNLCLGDEISPDSCRIWDMDTKTPFDKDRFRQDLGNVISSYQTIAERLGIVLPV